VSSTPEAHGSLHVTFVTCRGCHIVARTTTRRCRAVRARPRPRTGDPPIPIIRGTGSRWERA